jgi:hypothetical protein
MAGIAGGTFKGGCQSTASDRVSGRPVTFADCPSASIQLVVSPNVKSVSVIRPQLDGRRGETTSRLDGVRTLADAEDFGFVGQSFEPVRTQAFEVKA